MDIHVTVIGFERAAQTELAIDSFLKYKRGEHNIHFNIIYSQFGKEWVIADAFQKLILKRKDLKFTLVKIESDGVKYNIEDYLIKNEINLVLPGNIIFTKEFNLDDIYHIDFENEYFDLLNGVNRTQDSDGNYYNFSSLLRKRDKLYFYEQSPDLNINTGLFGKIFKVNNTPLDNKLKFFYGISPCFINTVNTVEYVDLYDLNDNSQYSTYAMGLRYFIGETLNIEALDGYCPNRIYDNVNLTFNINFEDRIINDVVDEVYYINLTKRHDRRELIDLELSRYNISAIRQEGFEISNDELDEYLKLHPEFNEHDIKLSRARVGCAKSHLEIIKKAKQSNLKSVLILEDDCEFVVNPNEGIKKAVSDLKKLPSCDILYLGANVLADITPLTPNIGKINASYCAHAYIVFSRAFDHILNFEWSAYRAIDELYMNMSRDSRFNVYTVLPVIAVQRASFSDIEDKNVDYSEVILSSYNTHLK